jgi:hypothetical protein
MFLGTSTTGAPDLTLSTNNLTTHPWTAWSGASGEIAVAIHTDRSPTALMSSLRDGLTAGLHRSRRADTPPSPTAWLAYLSEGLGLRRTEGD